jgi:hypothetical protein
VADALRDDPDRSMRARALSASGDADEQDDEDDVVWRMATEADKALMLEDPRPLRDALAVRGPKPR